MLSEKNSNLSGTLATTNAEQRMNKYGEIRWRAHETGRRWRLQSLPILPTLTLSSYSRAQMAKVRQSLAPLRGDYRN